ncbi:MAG: hypothetical protein IJW77_13320 [Clostridia bacterium]|nr:hypothetical protein [Clostridia bacterium]
MFKKLTTLLTIIGLMFCLAGCQTHSQTQTLDDAGESLIALMADMVNSEAYADLYDFPNAYADTTAKLREGDYKKPSAVYTLQVPENVTLLGETIPDGLSAPLDTYLHDAAFLAFSSRINQMQGVDALSASSMYAAQISFVGDVGTERALYLYTFADGYPIAVHFMPGTDGAVRAVGYFLLHEGLDTADADAIEESLASLGLPGITAEKQ